MMIRKFVASLVPRRLKPIVWYLTDSSYRQRLLDAQRDWTNYRNLHLQAAEVLAMELGDSVYTGPFQGLKYPIRQDQSTYNQKVLGTYEKELWPVLDEILSKRYSTIIVVGAAEGYYACGLSWRMQEATVIAFESSKKSRRALRFIAGLNGLIERIQIRGECGLSELLECTQDNKQSLLICDIEGAEADLLDPALIPSLHEMNMLVEVHEAYRPGVSDLLLQRFKQSHQIEKVSSETRTLGDFPLPKSALSDQLKLVAMDERRGPATSWIYLHRD